MNIQKVSSLTVHKRTISDDIFDNMRINQVKQPVNSSPHLSKETVRDHKSASNPETSKSHKVSDYDLALLLRERNNIAIIEDNIYIANYQYGYYENLLSQDSEVTIRNLIPEKYRKWVNSKSVSEIIQWMKTFKDLTVGKEVLNNRTNFVNFKNCVVDIRDLSVHDHSLSHYFTSVIDSDYFNYPAPSKLFEGMMDQISNDNDQIYDRLQEVFGYLLSEIRTLKQIFFLLGPKDSGKSLFNNLIMSIIGSQFCSHISLNDMNNKFRIGLLHGKKLNSFGETSEQSLTRLDLIKAACGNDILTGEFKFGHSFNFVNRAAFLYAGNELPKLKVKDQENSFTERLLIVPFLNKVPKKKQDVHLLEKLGSEKPYICKWALLGLQRLIDNNFRFTTCDTIEEIHSEYVNRNNSVKSFINEYCIVQPGLKTHTYMLENAYKDYCFTNNIHPVSDKEFHKELAQCGDIISGRFRLNNQNLNGYYGISIKEL